MNLSKETEAENQVSYHTASSISYQDHHHGKGDGPPPSSQFR